MARGVLILAALACAAAHARAQAVPNKARELARIQSELRQAQAELDALRAAQDSLGRELDQLQGQDARSQERMARARAAVRRAEAKRADLQSRLAATESVDGFWSGALAAEAARSRAAAASRSDFYGVDGLWAEEYARLAMFEKARRLRGLQGYERRAAADEASALGHARSLAADKRRAERERERRRRAYEAKKAELALAQSRVAEAARRAQELADSARALTALVARLGRARAESARPPVPGTAALSVPRRSLPWPVEGAIVSRFGREKDPELGTWIVRQGLTFRAAANAAVRAVADGRVIFAGPFRSYGNVVIVDHGRGFFSIYGALGRILASKDAKLKAGAEIGEAGRSADGAGRAYFEIRRGTQALDPTAWLKARQTP